MNIFLGTTMKNFSRILFAAFASISFQSLPAQVLSIPPRPANALKESVFVSMITPLSLQDRENAIYTQVVTGNIPDFMRALSPVTVNATINGTNHTATYYVTPEYLAIGADEDYFLMPMTPTLAQRIANKLQCNLPTKKMVDDIYAAAAVKLRPQPIPPSDAMITVPVFKQHNDSVWQLRKEQLSDHPLGALVGGHKKDVVVTNKLNNPTPTGKVAIYGWHQLNGLPIQSLYTGHGDTYADYSHGIRLVQLTMKVDGVNKTITEVLNDPNLAGLLSDEGLIPIARYPTPADSSAPVPPATPKSFGITNENGTSLRVNITFDNDTTNCTAYLSRDGVVFSDSSALSKNNPVISGLKKDSLYFFRLRAYNSAGYSPQSEVLGAVPSAVPPKVLIVNAFDRPSTGNTYNFIRQHGKAFTANGYAFSSATNEAVVKGLVPLYQYHIVDYILGDESTADETFSAAEQETVKTFLRSGGELFVSGSEIGWDLDSKGSASDKDFYQQFLKAQFVADAPNNGQSGVYYKMEPIGGKLFDGLEVMNFDNGTQGTINVKWPDVINGVNGGVNCLAYTGVTSNYAGVSYEGPFPGGTVAGKIINIGVPFETIYPDSARNAFMAKILAFFEKPMIVQRNDEISPTNFSLSQNYPNPFNPTTVIRYQLPVNSVVTLKIFDIIGREVAALVDGAVRAGEHVAVFEGKNLSSGVYFYRLQAGEHAETRKMILAK
jgi:Secretion system C-terminal sorting domain